MADFGITEAIGLAGAALSAAGTIAGGAAANKQAKSQDRIYRQQADQERAAANREAQQRRSQLNYLESKQQAAAAASGGGASDPTIIDLMSATEAEGEAQAKEAQYVGEVRATDLENQAAFVRERGRAARTAGYFKAGTTLVGAGLSLYDKLNPAGYDPNRTYSSGRGRDSYFGGGQYLQELRRPRYLMADWR